MPIRHEAQIDIARAPRSVIEFLSDLEQQPRFWATVERVHLLDGPAGRPGSTYERVLHAFGKPRTTVVRIESMTPAHELVIASLNAPLRVRARITAQQIPTGTRTHIQLEARLGWPWFWLAPLVKRRFIRNTRATLERLKELLEGPYTDPARISVPVAATPERISSSPASAQRQVPRRTP